MIIGKIWGQTEPVLKTPILEIHKLTILPNSYCSLHKHEFKWNCFIVISGQLVIEVKKNNYDLTDKTTINAGETTTVRPGEFHRFKTTEQGCTVFEIYYLEPLSEDIVRADVGGTAE